MVIGRGIRTSSAIVQREALVTIAYGGACACARKVMEAPDLSPF
jgi:hypothetical protein